MGDNKEVMSLISDTQFNVFDNEEGDEVITFRSALISGDAASSLSGNKLVEAAGAISGANIIPSYSDLAKSSKKVLCALEPDNFIETKEIIVGSPHKDLSSEQIEKLESNTAAGKGSYTLKLHNELSSLLQTEGDCQ
jgi:hypothetical protein